MGIAVALVGKVREIEVKRAGDTRIVRLGVVEVLGADTRGYKLLWCGMVWVEVGFEEGK